MKLSIYLIAMLSIAKAISLPIELGALSLYHVKFPIAYKLSTLDTLEKRKGGGGRSSGGGGGGGSGGSGGNSSSRGGSGSGGHTGLTGSGGGGVIMTGGTSAAYRFEMLDHLSLMTLGVVLTYSVLTL